MEATKMASSPSAPPAPDYTGAAEATAAGNAANLQAQTVANRPNQTTPLGSSTWTQGANGQWSQNVTLTPAEQSALTAQQSISANQSSLASGLQGQVASTMANGYTAPSMSSYMGGVPGVNSNFQSFSPSGVSGVNQSLNPGVGVNTNAQGAVAGAGSVDQAAPQFSTANAQSGAQAAYQAQMGLLQPQMTQDTTNLDSQLRLQGLTPGTDAYNNAMQNLQRTQAQTTTTAANNAVQTGNNEANQNYASELAGYGAQNAAQNQAYSQGANTFTMGNTAAGQQYGQNANTFTADNAAQGQAYSQSLAGYGANQNAQQASNAAQSQTYQQALQNYNTAYTSDYQNYMTPLNSLNAVLQGNQVQEPNMPIFATAGNVAGADLSGAAQSQGQYNSAATAAADQSASSANGMIGSAAAAAMMAASMY
jgi:hypothetical protein